MARQLFIDSLVLDRIKENIFSKNWLEETDQDFARFCHEQIAGEVEELLRLNLDEKTCAKLFYLGSFARFEACPDSDLDLLYLGPEEEALKVNKKLRGVFRKYSVKYLPKNGVDFVSKEDPFGVISLHWARAVFKADINELKFLKKQIDIDLMPKVKEAIYNDRQSRGARFGDFPGKLSYNFKNSRGGLKETLQAVWLLEKESRVVDQKVFKQRAFISKLRSINHFLGNFDTLSLSSANEYLKFFKSPSGTEFFKEFYSYTEWGHIFTIRALYPNTMKTDLSLDLNLKDLKNQRDLLEHNVPAFLNVKGLAQSPSYHTWAVGEHLIQCVSYVNDIINDEGDAFELTDFEKDALLWAALFHDIKKGEDRPHSILGSEFARDYGREKGWSEEKTKLVAWLVREHLTLSKFAFGDDPYLDEGIKKLYLRGVEKRRAVLLCLLTEADIKATNLSSWSTWKKQMLRSLLDRLLKKESSNKEKLVQSVKGNDFALELAESLTPTEIASIPYSLLEEDLKNIDEEHKIKFYELGDRIWMRFYKEHDEKGIALDIISRLYAAGGYTHHAHFKTLENKKVYDWFCIEVGVSMKAFEKRFHALKPQIKKPELKFSKIRQTYSGEGRAVVSFKGKDEQGMLLAAIYILTELGLDIRWGHAVTWGEQIEDVFAVQFSGEPDWSKLREYVSV